MIFLYWLIFLALVCLREFRVLKDEKADIFLWGSFFIMSLAFFGIALMLIIFKYQEGDPR